MNEFTKEELEDIYNCVWIYDDLHDDSTHEYLLKKLKSMIDNYCEHEPANECIALPIGKYTKCVKCGTWYK